MFCGFSRNVRGSRFSLLAWLLIGAAAAVQAQVCELPMAVPATDGITTQLETNVRGLALRLTWPLPDDAQSTCFALLDTAALDVEMSLSGTYIDNFDRMLRFTFNDSGLVGSTERNQIVVTWENANRSRTGAFGGDINLSNTGGLWVREGGVWSQLGANEGLPRYLPFTNLDAVAQAGGTWLTALTNGTNTGVGPVGVFRKAGAAAWQEVGSDIFGETTLVDRLAIDPADGNRFVVGTHTEGVYLTSDGGATFTPWTLGRNPISALVWTATRLYAAMTGRGLFISADGATWSELPSLRVPRNLDSDPTLVIPQINQVVEDPANPDHIYALLVDHAIYHSLDAGATWLSLGGDWIVPDPDHLNAWRRTGMCLQVAGSRLLIGTRTHGIWRSTDGGQHWSSSSTPIDDLPPEQARPAIVDIVAIGGELFAMADGFNLLHSTDDGLTWTAAAEQLVARNATRMITTPSGELALATYRAGIYVPGTPLTISDTITRGDEEYLDIQLGLTLAFESGSIAGASADGSFPGETFRVNAQDFQGWIVWRADRDQPDEMVMIGRYDRNNPESCIEGFCGDDSYIILPNCFAERRAACFDFSVPGQASFFDGDVYNGFEYYYAVTPYDYGDVSEITSVFALDQPMVFPARFPGDPFGLGEGSGNRFAREINEPAQPAVDGNEIYVYPNPLRAGAGIVGGEGEEVRWANLPPGAQIEVYTVAGDKIANLGGAAQHEGNIYWTTRNDDGQQLASGIYLWRCIMPERNDFWGKLIIIR